MEAARQHRWTFGASDGGQRRQLAGTLPRTWAIIGVVTDDPTVRPDPVWPSPMWEPWAAARPVPGFIHLDSAAAGRSSRAVLDATSRHAVREATEGAYVAAAAVAAAIASLRANVAALTGVDPQGVAFVESAESALNAVLQVWPLTDGDAVAVAPSEWGPNLHAFRVAGLDTTWLEVDAAGVIDLAALDRRLRTAPPAFVHVTQQASHRALRQPVAEMATMCTAAGVPLWVDAAQAAGHCAIEVGADVVYATSRKWLAGPRGVGLLAVKKAWRDVLRVDPSPMATADDPLLSSVESHEAHIAGRVGLATAVDEFIAIGPEAVSERLDAVRRMTRAHLSELPHWTVVDPIASPGAITAIAPAKGQDVFEVRERLLRSHSIVTTACQVARAPLDMPVPWLRISPHVDATPEQIVTLCDALATL